MINPNDPGNTPTRRWIAIVGFSALLVAVALQARSISELRHEIESLRAQLQAAPPDGSNQSGAAGAAEAIDLKQLQKERLEFLGLLVVQGLETAAAAGNATAVDGLATLAAGTNQFVRKEAVLALEAAARKNQPQAEEALRRLGWR